MNPNVFGEFANEIIKISGLLGADKSFVEGLTPKQVHIVMEIGTNSFRHGELARNIGVEPSTLTRTLEPLVKAGLVDRQPNPANRREVLICLSEQGLTVLQEINNKMSHFCADILKHVPDHQLEQVESSLTLLLNIMKQLHSDK
jgi:DNA-binding MarR family transcriptional regulator